MITSSVLSFRFSLFVIYPNGVQMRKYFRFGICRLTSQSADLQLEPLSVNSRSSFPHSTKASGPNLHRRDQFINQMFLCYISSEFISIITRNAVLLSRSFPLDPLPGPFR